MRQHHARTQQFFKDDGYGGAALFEPWDFWVGASFELNGRNFTVVDADVFTRNWFSSHGQVREKGRVGGFRGHILRVL